MDYRGILLISCVLTLLAAATIVAEFFRNRPGGIDAATLSSCRSRLNAWWLLFGSLTCALLLGTAFTVFFFGAVSFWALREYVTITPTRLADHKMLVGVFFVLTPLQFLLVGVDPEWFVKVFRYEPYYFYSAMIPSLAFLILPACVALSDDKKYFLERIAKLQVGLLICVYSLSFAPALLTTTLPERPAADAPAVDVSDLPAVHLGSRVVSQFEQVASGKSVGHDVDSADANAGDVASATGAETEIDPDPERKRNPSNVLLLFVFVLLTQISDFSQFAWSLIFPQHKIAPHVNSNRSYEGVALGVLTTAFFAIAMWRFTPFDSWEKAAVAGLVISIMGFAGNITVSAIKRDQGVGDFETLIEGHNGILDRIDSLCFAAPVFFHYIRILS
ncbi:MAG: phosphatidate cytidylyltransferase [Thermoguttaceae bacterium]|jgi:phosphatidate cytidylyltransferase